jgi:hypothetical protein
MSVENRSSFTFQGFERPDSNFYRLPNDWFDIWSEARGHLSGYEPASESNANVRILAPLKLLEYVMRHTWGYQQFQEGRRLTYDEIRNGRFRKGGQRFDQGTGLSPASISKAIEALHELGMLHVEKDDHDAARRQRWYRPQLSSEEAEAEPEEAPDQPFVGFDDPRANYFILPNNWTDQIKGLRSETQILAAEYLIRHTWGWQCDGPRERWLSAEEIAAGRTRRDGSRYDRGIGYHPDTVKKACDANVTQGLLVAREGTSPTGRKQRQYALRLLGRDEVGEADESVALTDESVALADEPVVLTDEPEALTDESEALTDESEALTDESVAPTDRSVERSHGDILGDTSGDTNSDPSEETQQQHTLGAAQRSPSAAQPCEGTPLSVADALSLEDLLHGYGIENPKLQQLLRVQPDRQAALGWMLYAEAQAGLTNRQGYVIERLLDPQDRRHAPAPFYALAGLSRQDWQALAQTNLEVRWGRSVRPPSRLREIWPQWRDLYGKLSPEALPMELGAGVDRSVLDPPDVPLRQGLDDRPRESEADNAWRRLRNLLQFRMDPAAFRFHFGQAHGLELLPESSGDDRVLIVGGISKLSCELIEHRLRHVVDSALPQAGLVQVQFRPDNN